MTLNRGISLRKASVTPASSLCPYMQMNGMGVWATAGTAGIAQASKDTMATEESNELRHMDLGPVV
ncbi:MAG: hypothetical protein QGG09_01565 [Pirellulaceae bacterium]|nr:hypothetical protein [Pirellulaceae bacterium]HJN09096.1 hypothetical protein [Pirellulaceae bacterium]